MNLKIVLLCFVMSLTAGMHVTAQAHETLEEYLATHRYYFVFNKDSTLSVSDELGKILLKRMAQKSLFVYGEGWSHSLHTNNLIIQALIRFYEYHGLKGFFLESARSWVVEDEHFFTHDTISSSIYYPSESMFYQKSFELKRQLYHNGNYRYLATDFERPRSLYRVLSLLSGELSIEHRNKLKLLAPYIVDTSWLQFSPKRFVTFYKEQRDDFFRDSSGFKTIMGEAYPAFRYLMSDPEPAEYHDNRNALMADHVLEELPPYTTDELYMFDCGVAHARAGKKNGLQKTAVHVLSESERLKNRIVVMNLYGDSCASAGDNWALDFMKGSVLASFKMAVTTPIVVFDLTDIPLEYRYITKDYGDFLVYVTGAN